jgi:hypothetical protein
MPDGHRPVADPPPVIGIAGGLQQRVELLDGVHRRHRHAVVAAEPAALAFHPALLVAALMPRNAIPGVEAVVRAERDPALVLHPGAAKHHPLDRAGQVVVADLLGRHPAQPPERIDVALQERLLPLRQRGPVRGPPRIRQPHREQGGLRLHPAQEHPQIVEIHLALGPRLIRLRHAPRLQRPPRPGEDLRAAPGHIVPHRRIRDRCDPVLVHQPRQDPPGGMPLLLRRVQILPQHRVDQRLHRIQRRRREHPRLPRRRHRARQRLPHRPPVHPVPVCQLPDRQPLPAMITPDRLEQLHPRSHLPWPLPPGTETLQGP